MKTNMMLPPRIKNLMAHILKGCVPEFRDFDIETIIAEGLEKDAEVGKVIVHRPTMLKGMSTEDATTEVTEMCNLSVGIEERGIEKGIEKGARETNRRLRDRHIDLEERAEIVGFSIDTIKAWDEEEMPVPV